MSFREKSTWISFVLLLVLFAIYVWPAIQSFHGQVDDPRDVLFFFHDLFVAFVLLQVALHAVVVLRSPKEARTPKDERERSIELKACRIGFYTFALGGLLALAVNLHASPPGTPHAVLLAMVLAWLAKLGSQLVYYRRGA